MNNATSPQPIQAEIERAINLLFDGDEVVEVRAFHKGKKRTDAGYFDGQHRNDLVQEAIRLNTAGAAVYVTLNRLDPQLLGRYANRIESFANTTASDTNVIRRVRGTLARPKSSLPAQRLRGRKYAISFGVAAGLIR